MPLASGDAPTKVFTGTPAEAERLRDLDAKAGGLPLAGVLVGFGPRKAIGGGTADGDWFGWTRWRYAPEAGSYPVDALLEAHAAKAPKELTEAEATELRAMVARAVEAVAEPLELAP